MLPRQARPLQPKRRMLVAFAAAGRRWALPAEEVAGVAALGPVTPLPTAEPGLLGVTLHRGRALALLAADGDGAAGLPAAGHLVALRGRWDGTALPAEELIGLRTVTGDSVPDGFELWRPDRPARSRPDAAPAPAAEPALAARTAP